MKKLLLALLILSSSTLWAKKYALMVGVNDVRGNYTLFTDIDLQLMEKTLKSAGFEITKLKGKNASLAKVRNAFKKYYELNKSDTFLFYYTGHGARMKGINKNEKNDNLLVLNDANISLDTIGGGILSDNEYSMHLHKIAAQKISIIDACHSASIYKDLSINPRVKGIISKGVDNIFKRDSSVQSFHSFKPNNLINISAAQDNQVAESTPIGSIFTVALTKLIKNNPNISFSTLEKKLVGQMKPTARSISQRLANLYPHKYFIYREVEGKFKPSINTAPMALKSLKVKDIFVKKREAKPSLSNVLDSKPPHKPQQTNKLSISTANGKTNYALGAPIKFNITSKIKTGHLYLFEKKKENYTILGEKTLQNCQDLGKEMYCKFDNILASKPLGESVAYVVITKKPLTINHQSITKDFKIDQDFFGTEERLAQQIKKERVAQISLTLDIQ